MGELSVVGKNVTRIDALEKVTGKAKYCADLKLPGMLHGKVLRSPYAHAKIISIDISKAEQVPGVRAIVTGKNVPESREGFSMLDKHSLCRDVVRCVGDGVAAVAAVSPEAAEEALGLIEVKYEELPAVYDAEEAFSTSPVTILHPNLPNYERVLLPEVGLDLENRPNVHSHYKIRKGDVEKGFKEADLIVENRFSVPRIIHAQLEPNNCIAKVESDGSLTVWTTVNSLRRLKALLCRTFNLSPARVKVISLYVGGAFGGLPVIEQFAVLLTFKTGRPVKIALDREEVFTSTYWRSPFVIYLKDGVKRDGTLVAREMKAISDGGAYFAIASVIVRQSAMAAVPLYRVPNCKIDNYGVYTNAVAAAPFRGMGVPQPTFAIEQQMDIIAEQLGIDAIELRKINLLKEGERNIQGEITPSIVAQECLDAVADWIGWGKPSKADAGPWRRGKGLALGSKMTVGGTASSVFVKMHQDGCIELRHNADEIGQGVNTVLAQIVAEELGVSMDNIKIVRGDTAVAPYDHGSVASRSTFHTGNAIRIACQNLKRQIFERASEKLGVSPDKLETREGKVYVKGARAHEKAFTIAEVFPPTFGQVGLLPDEVELVGKGAYVNVVTPIDPETGQGERQGERVNAYYGEGAQAVEVAVNVETGEVKVLRACSAFNMGQPINPKLCEGQMEGGMAKAIGAALYEEIIMDNGRVLNPGFKDYRIPFAEQIPSMKDVKSMIVFAPEREGPYGAKGLGEGTTVPMAPAIANAVYNAIGVRIKDLPITTEKVIRALKEAGEA